VVEFLAAQHGRCPDARKIADSAAKLSANQRQSALWLDANHVLVIIGELA
jgi:hypothetical protein